MTHMNDKLIIESGTNFKREKELKVGVFDQTLTKVLLYNL